MSELLNNVRNVMRVRHYSYETEKIYIYWIKQYIYFHKITHPAEMGAAEICLEIVATREKNIQKFQKKLRFLMNRQLVS